ncbi:hypothetical protein [[Clostridium] dakarense]|nr:hypothetical protein [[Clostridium] dakarense]
MLDIFLALDSFTTCGLLCSLLTSDWHPICVYPNVTINNRQY